MDLDQSRWMLENYARNPVVLWGHDYWGERPPIGRAEVAVEGERLLARVRFDQEDGFARQVERKYRDGFLNAVSVGWRTVKEDGSSVDWEDIRKGETELFYELLDISAVPVPGDPDALLLRQERALRGLRDALDLVLDDAPGTGAGSRGAVAPHSTAKAAEDVEWDGADHPGRGEMCAWGDGERFELPHHLSSGEVVWRGVAAAMLRLFQADIQIPDEDWRGVYGHLARHYGQFGKEAPEFRSREELEVLGVELVRGLFAEGEAEGDQDGRGPDAFGQRSEEPEEADPVLVKLCEILRRD
jgi:hypothetical protein